jgi:uncharacterized membrane protein HdeD (DUF308 family)
MTALGGIAAVVVGLYLLFVPGVTAVVMIGLVAVYWLIGGIVKVVRTLMHRGIGWGWDLAGALLSIAVGALVLSSGLSGVIFSIEVLYVSLAVGGLLIGCMEIIRGIRDRYWPQILLGIAEMLLGLLLLTQPTFGMAVAVWLIGLALIAVGFSWLINAFQRA